MQKPVPRYWFAIAVVALFASFHTSRQSMASVDSRVRDEQLAAHEKIAAQTGKWEKTQLATFKFERPLWWTFAKDLTASPLLYFTMRPRIDPYKLNTWKYTFATIQYGNNRVYGSVTPAALRSRMIIDPLFVQIRLVRSGQFPSMRDYTEQEITLADVKGLRMDFTVDYAGEAYSVTHVDVQGAGHWFVLNLVTPKSNKQAAQEVFTKILGSVAKQTATDFVSSKKSSKTSSVAKSSAAAMAKSSSSARSAVAVPVMKPNSASSRAMTPFEIFMLKKKQQDAR